MARRKRKLEAIEALDRSEMTKPPLLMTNEELLYWYGLLDHALAKANPQDRETRSLAEIVSDIESDKSKSRTRKEFDIYVAGVADRIKDHLEPNQQPLHLESEIKNKSDDSDVLPLRERIKFLRQRLN